MRVQPAAQVGPCPGAHPVAVGIGAAQDDRRQGRFFGFRQAPGRAALGPIVQPRQTFGVVAHHRVAQGLALHAGKTGGVCPAQAIQRVGNGVHAGRRMTIAFLAGQPPQLF